TAGPAQVVDLVFLEKEFNASGEFVGDLARASDHFLPIIGKTFQLQAELVGAMRDGVVELGVLEKSFGRDTAPVETGPPGAIILDAGDFFSELGGANCSDVSAGATTDDNKIVRCHE